MSSGPNMLKFIWGKGQGPSAERVKVQKQLFGFSREVSHGFPSKPTCFAWDTELKLLSIAAKGGRVLVYGQPGVELELQLEEEEVAHLLFVPGQGRLLAITTDNRIHLLEVTEDNRLVLAKSHHLEGRLKTVSALCLEAARKRLVIGTEGGNIYLLRLWNLSLEQEIIYQDQVVANVPDTFRLNPGAVETILEDPAEANRLLVGYTRGLVVLWDKATQAAVQTFVSQQQLESLAWTGDSQFVSSHNDGSFIVWDANTGSQVEPPNTPYGPYPCKSIVKFYGNGKTEDSWRIFMGGMPRASYGEKFTVTIIKNEDDQTVLDLASKIVDFLVIETSEGAPDSLLILSEEELVAVDLKVAGWPLYEVPYLHSIHASAITCLAQVTHVSGPVLAALEQLRSGQQQAASSTNPWPVTGGTLSTAKADQSQGLLLTGHEDGSVRFWGLAGNVLTPLTVFKTAKLFKADDLDADGEGERPNGAEEEEDEEEWPPFRKVGMFDPYSDDPRLAVKKLAFCGESGRLVVGGTAGQVVICKLALEAAATTDGSTDTSMAAAAAAKLCKAEIVTEKEGFTWKGHQPLAVRTGAALKQQQGGWQPQVVLQISPPASITALTLHREWGVLAAGTAHGFVLLDFSFGHIISARSTLNAQDIANADDNPMSRRKSLKKSLRESFRRLRKGRSQRQVDKKKATAGNSPAGGDVIKRELRAESPEARPVERQVEARGSTSEDGLGSMVRCLHFAQTYITGPTAVSATLWAGTNSGQVLIFLLNITPEDQRKNDKITAVLAKEIQLKHRAPVIDIVVFDSGGLPVSGAQAEFPSPHKVLIASEEQFKVFLLPNLKPCGKYKLTAHEGARVRKVKAVTFTSSTESPAAHAENCVVFLTNLGEVSILAFPDLKRQVTTAAIRKEDVVGISSLVFSEAGDAVYMSSSSELQLLTVAASRVGFCKQAKGTVVVPPECRAVSEEPATETDRQADLQNRQNEREAEQNGTQARASPRSLGDEGLMNDTHNETTISEASGDITLDSVKDHIVSQSLEISTVETAGGTRTERVETVSRIVESVSVVRTQQIVVGEVVMPPPVPSLPPPDLDHAAG